MVLVLSVAYGGFRRALKTAFELTRLWTSVQSHFQGLKILLYLNARKIRFLCKEAWSVAV